MIRNIKNWYLTSDLKLMGDVEMPTLKESDDSKKCEQYTFITNIKVATLKKVDIPKAITKQPIKKNKKPEQPIGKKPDYTDVEYIITTTISNKRDDGIVEDDTTPSLERFRLYNMDSWFRNYKQHSERVSKLFDKFNVTAPVIK